MIETREQFRERIGTLADDAYEKTEGGEGTHYTALHNSAEAVYATALRDVIAVFPETCGCQNCVAARSVITAFAATRGIDLGTGDERPCH